MQSWADKMVKNKSYTPKTASRIIAAFVAAIILLSSLGVTSYANAYTPSSAAYLPFNDLKSDWSREYISYVYSNSLMNGIGDGRFGPTLPLTRGMVVTVLYRLEGQPACAYQKKFADVPSGKYYSIAATWASKQGIVSYTHVAQNGAPCFSPDRNITRQELAVMFYRYAEYKNINILSVKNLSAFTDGYTVASWADEGIRWAVRSGLINGTGNGTTLSPTGEATREQFAAIVTRYLNTDFLYLPEHIFYDNKNKGLSGELVGKVAVISIFVSDLESSWTTNQRDTAISYQQDQLNDLDSEADRYGADFDPCLGYYEFNYNGIFNNDTYYNATTAIIQGLGFGSMADVHSKAEEYFGTEESAIIFCVNKKLRSFAFPVSYDSSAEFAIVYYEDSGSYAHELCHLFGARDYYIHNDITSSATRNFGNCLMTDSYVHVVDSLSAYLMGWTESPLTDAMRFLNETSHVTREDFEAAKNEAIYTGYVTGYRGNGFTYTGYLDTGIMQGYGELVYDNGNTYVGYFSNGLFHGNGTFRWANTGDSYSGEWNCGNIHGQGTYTWSTGSSYSGGWYYDDRHGEGIYTAVGGRRYREIWNYGNMVSRTPI